MEPATLDAFHADIMEIKPGFHNGESVNIIAFRGPKTPSRPPTIAPRTVFIGRLRFIFCIATC